MDKEQSTTGGGMRGGNGRYTGVADQAPPVGKPRNAYAGMGRNVTALVHDALRLGDLQLQLLSTDVQEFWSRARVGLVLGVVGAVSALAALPVLLMGIARYLSLAFSISEAAALVIVALLAIVLGGIAAGVGIHRLTKAGATLGRSQAELSENLAWFRSLLHRQAEQEDV